MLAFFVQDANAETDSVKDLENFLNEYGDQLNPDTFDKLERIYKEIDDAVCQLESENVDLKDEVEDCYAQAREDVEPIQKLENRIEELENLDRV